MKNPKIFVVVMMLVATFQIGQAQDKTADAQWAKQVQASMTRSDNSSDSANVTNDKQVKRIKIDYWSYIKIIIVLALLIIAIYVIFKFMKKFLKIRDDVGENAQVITSQTLGPNKWLQVVYIHGKYLILGVTNENINLIGEITDPKEIERLEIYANDQAVNKGSSFQDLFTNLKNAVFGKKSAKDDFDYEKNEIDFLKKQQSRFDNKESDDEI